jgi:hypothetical protein
LPVTDTEEVTSMRQLLRQAWGSGRQLRPLDGERHRVQLPRRAGTSRVAALLVCGCAAILLAISGGESARASVTESKWQYGWGLFSGPLDFSRSNVLWAETNGSTLQTVFTFVGARPDAQYTVGIALLYGEQSQCRPSFGQFELGPCYDVTLQGVTSWEDDTNFYSPPGVGVLTTDGAGDGSLHVKISGIAPGDYSLEFYANDGLGPGQINFQSPGPFGTAIHLTFARRAW